MTLPLGPALPSDFCLSAFAASSAAKACLGALPLMTLLGPAEVAVALLELACMLLASASGLSGAALASAGDGLAEALKRLLTTELEPESEDVTS